MRLALLFAMMISLSAAASAQSDAFLLEPGRAGSIRTGMFVDSVYRRVPREAVALVDLFSEGMFTPAIAIRLPGSVASPAIVAPISEWPCFVFAVRSLDVRDPRFRTARGIGVGSTVGEIRRAYPDARLSEEEGLHVWVESLRMSFRLESASQPDSSRVVAVWLIGDDPRRVRQQLCPQLGPLR